MTTFNINKFNFHLIKAFQYLSNFNLAIYYKIDKLNVILNAFSKLSKKDFDSFFEEILNILYDHIVKIFDLNFINIIKVKVVYHITLIEMSNNFKI